MNKKETLDVLETIEQYYQNFLVDQKRLDAWHFILKDYELSDVVNNLKKYVSENEFPPKPKNLLDGLIINKKYNIPGIEETKKIMEGYQVPESERLPIEERKALAAKLIKEVKAGRRK